MSLSAANFPWTAANRPRFVAGVAATFIVALVVPSLVFVVLGWWPGWTILLTTVAAVASAVLFNRVYRSIGRRVDALRGDATGVVLRADCRIAAANSESPGIAEIREDGTLVLRPITGNKIVLPLARLSHQESRWLNGERLWGEARAFALRGADAPPVLLAVERAAAWREQFTRSRGPRPAVGHPASA